MPQITVHKVQEGHYTLTSLPCPKCKQCITVDANGAQIWLYNQNKPFQQIFPDMGIDTIERFISGFCAPCWNKVFWYDDEPEA